MDNNEFEVKIKNYRGNVTHNWKAPKTRRQAIYAITKLAKLYERCKESNLLTVEMTRAIKGYAEALSTLATTKVFLVARPELQAVLNKLSDIEVEVLIEELITEKKREHGEAVCSLCKTGLKYPAYVVYRKGFEVVSTSAPIGIFCLKNLYGKLNDLTKEVLLQVPSTDIVNSREYLPMCVNI